MPLTILANEFRRALDSMQINLPMAVCDNKTPQSVQPVSKEGKTGEEQPQESSDPNLVRPEVYKPDIRRKRLNPFQGSTPRVDGNEHAAPPSLWLSIPWWLPLLIIIGLAVLTWKVYFFFRHHKNDKKKTSSSPSVSLSQADTAEAGTAPLSEGTGKPRSASVDDTGLPDMSTLPDSCNGVLVIDCFVDAETRLRRFCLVNTEQMSIVIGCGDAEISIEHAMVSPAHARLENDGEHMTLSDLGSKWGTSINGVPCLPGEVMFIDIDDEIFLGDIQLLITILMKETDTS